jgi:DNA/RNA endonuclease YhcR with UshA esterase domain
VLIFLNTSTDINPHASYLKAGRRLRATGFGNQYDTTYEVDPRSRRDLVALP